MTVIEIVKRAPQRLCNRKKLCCFTCRSPVQKIEGAFAHCLSKKCNEIKHIFCGKSFCSKACKLKMEAERMQCKNNTETDFQSINKTNSVINNGIDLTILDDPIETSCSSMSIGDQNNVTVLRKFGDSKKPSTNIISSSLYLQPSAFVYNILSALSILLLSLFRGALCMGPISNSEQHDIDVYAHCNAYYDDRTRQNRFANMPTGVIGHSPKSAVTHTNQFVPAETHMREVGHSARMTNHSEVENTERIIYTPQRTHHSSNDNISEQMNVLIDVVCSLQEEISSLKNENEFLKNQMHKLNNNIADVFEHVNETTVLTSNCFENTDINVEKINKCNIKNENNIFAMNKQIHTLTSYFQRNCRKINVLQNDFLKLNPEYNYTEDNIDKTIKNFVSDDTRVHKNNANNHLDSFDVTKKIIYIGRLPNNTSESTIINYFGIHGAIKNIFININRHFALIEYHNASDANTAVNEMNGANINNHRIVCELSKLQIVPAINIKQQYFHRQSGSDQNSRKRFNRRQTTTNLPTNREYDYRVNFHNSNHTFTDYHIPLNDFHRNENFQPTKFHRNRRRQHYPQQNFQYRHSQQHAYQSNNQNRYHTLNPDQCQVISMHQFPQQFRHSILEPHQTSLLPRQM